MSEASDLLMWVGGGSYSRESFLEEAKKMGACRRVSRIPRGLVIGRSRVFLISDMSEIDRKRYKEELKRRQKLRYQQWKEKGCPRGQKNMTSVKEGPMPRGDPQVFAWFVVKGVSMVVSPGVDIDEELKKRGITKYEYKEGAFGFGDERGCGSLVVGGTYILSEEDISKCADLAKSGTVKGSINILSPPVPYSGKRFRGFKCIPRSEGDKLLEGSTIG